MLTIHGKGGHAKVVADAADTTVAYTDDADGTSPGPDDCYICAVGDNSVRKRIGGTARVVHKTSVLADSAVIGRGVYLGALCSIGPDAVIGDCAIVNTGAIVEHDCEVGPHSHICPGAVLCGGVKVLEGATVGARAVVKQGVTIGAWAVIGCGAAVVCDVPPNETWAGVPARKLP